MSVCRWCGAKGRKTKASNGWRVCADRAACVGDKAQQIDAYLKRTLPPEALTWWEETKR
jgi:hypothetical protein